MTNPQKFTLKYPVTFGSETITEVTVRRPKGKDLRGIKDVQSTDGMILMIARLIERETAVVHEMDAEDLMAIGEVVAGFLGLSQPTSTAA